MSIDREQIRRKMRKWQMTGKLQLFLTMMKIGIFTFGGGYAMIALLQNEFVMRKKWIKNDEFLDMVAVAETTPGPLAINCATYIGYNVGGTAGAFATTLGVVIPSFFIVYLISLFFDRFMSLRYVACAFKGIQVCVVYMIASAGVSLWKSMKKNIFSILIFLTVFITMTVLSVLAVKLSSVLYIIFGGGLGFAAYRIRQKKGDEHR